jgi:DNA-binding NtrC family response regulator
LSDPIKPRRILVVDDECLIRWSLSQALTKQGHQVLSAENGKKAIEILKAQAFDFIITDLLMPESDGWEVLEVSRKSQPRPRVIIISAHGVEGTEEMARVKGAWAYLEKPYVFDKIKDLLK